MQTGHEEIESRRGSVGGRRGNHSPPGWCHKPRDKSRISCHKERSRDLGLNVRRCWHIALSQTRRDFEAVQNAMGLICFGRRGRLDDPVIHEKWKTAPCLQMVPVLQKNRLPNTVGGKISNHVPSTAQAQTMTVKPQYRTDHDTSKTEIPVLCTPFPSFVLACAVRSGR